MLKKILGTIKVNKKDEFNIEVNMEETKVMEQGVELVANEKLAAIAKEMDIDKIRDMIEIYNNGNQLLDIIKDELENNYEEITVNEIQLGILLDALNKVEDITTKNLKLVDEPSDYKALCKNMVTVTTLIDKIMNLV